jgi:hypothetical protein
LLPSRRQLASAPDTFTVPLNSIQPSLRDTRKLAMHDRDFFDGRQRPAAGAGVDQSENAVRAIDTGASSRASLAIRVVDLQAGGEQDRISPCRSFASTTPGVTLRIYGASDWQRTTRE